MRVTVCIGLLLCSSVSGAAEETTEVTILRGAKRLTFKEGLATQAEGRTLALLGCCTAHGTDRAKEYWDRSLKGDHVRVRYARPRLFTLTGEQPKVWVDEIVVSVPTEGAEPTHVVVRSGKEYHWYSKYDHETVSQFLRFVARFPRP
jgi:3-deoxy-D-arabino-heptulosonate 7-phosphate (DAHP) synthase